MNQDSDNLIETMSTDEVPIGFQFVHLQNADGDDVIRYIWAEWWKEAQLNT